MGLVVASDGLLARKNARHGEAKVQWLQWYVEAALQATQRMPRRWYVDLFAGPGRNIDPSGHEYPSMAVTAATIADRTGRGFHQCILGNLHDEQATALHERIDRAHAAGQLALSRANVQCIVADANHVAADIMSGVARRDYVLASLDIEAPRQLPFRTVRTLLARGHTSVDLYMLLPLHMGVNRAAGTGSGQAYESVTSFFGTSEWLDVWYRHPSGGTPRTTALLEFYLQQLRSEAGWKHAEVVLPVRSMGGQKLYQMLLATNNDTALKIAKGVRKRSEQPQLPGLF